MSELNDLITSYKNLSFSDRVAFYTTVSNDISVDGGDLQPFLIETRLTDGKACIYCEGSRVVKNGTRKDGTQRYLCRDCGKSFIPSSHSVTSRTRKRLSVWADYLRCMMDRKTLKESAEECQISVSTAFAWRHKILDALQELAGRACLDGTVEADETYFNVSYKGNHTKSRDFTMPRPAHKRGDDVHTKGLSSEKVCVPCAVSDRGIAYAKPVKLGKVSSECIKAAYDQVISPGAVLCTDREKAYLALAEQKGLDLVRMDTGRCTTRLEGKAPGAVLCTDQEKAYLALAEQKGLDLVRMDTGRCTTRLEGKAPRHTWPWQSRRGWTWSGWIRDAVPPVWKGRPRASRGSTPVITS